ncbi:uncharacterized protein [Periplaneta americana]|uniref:uncharacterized protein isoform X2 n=1 Tax=Periplaneta americana TaxID=6978 RepID=UPI0037E755A5
MSKQQDRKRNRGKKQQNRSFSEQTNQNKHNSSNDKEELHSNTMPSPSQNKGTSRDEKKYNSSNDKEELHSNTMSSPSQNKETSTAKQNDDGNQKSHSEVDNAVTPTTQKNSEENATQLLEMPPPNICYTCFNCKEIDPRLSDVLREMWLSHPDKNNWLHKLRELNKIQPSRSEFPTSKQLSAAADEFRPSSETDQYSCNLTTVNNDVVDEEINESGAEASGNYDMDYFDGERIEKKPDKSNWDIEIDKNKCVPEEDRNQWKKEEGGNAWSAEDKSDERNSSEDRQNNNIEMRGGRNRDDRRDEHWRRDHNRDHRQNNWRGQGDQRGGRQEGRGRDNTRYKIVTEVDGDLFTAPKEYSLAHCVATDLRMGSGIAVTFRQEFKSVGELFDQKPRVGHMCVLDHEERFIYYLITKKYSNDKPRFEDLVASVQRMKDHCVKHTVKLLAMPRIGCGLDRLEWKEVKPMIEDTFSGVDIKITVYNYNRMNEDDEENSKGTKYSKNYVRFVDRRNFSLIGIEPSTALVFFGSEDNEIDDCGKTLDNKFHFLLDYRKREKKVGEAIRIEKRGECLFCLVVKKKSSDEFSYKNFEKCLYSLRKYLKNDQFFYVGVQSFRTEDDDPVTMEKIISVLKNCLTNSSYEVHICWPKEFENDCKRFLAQGMPSERDFTPQERRAGFSLMRNAPWHKPYLFSPTTISDAKRRKVIP